MCTISLKIDEMHLVFDIYYHLSNRFCLLHKLDVENSLDTKNGDIFRMLKYDTSHRDFVFDQNLLG